MEKWQGCTESNGKEKNTKCTLEITLMEISTTIILKIFIVDEESSILYLVSHLILDRSCYFYTLNCTENSLWD